MLSSDNTNVFNVLNKSFLTNSSEIRIHLYPDKDNAEYQDVVLEASNWEARIDSTIVNNPVVVTLTGRDIKTAIPDYYKTP
jgi:hypothetical protein